MQGTPSGWHLTHLRSRQTDQALTCRLSLAAITTSNSTKATASCMQVTLTGLGQQQRNCHATGVAVCGLWHAREQEAQLHSLLSTLLPQHSSPLLSLWPLQNILQESSTNLPHPLHSDDTNNRRQAVRSGEQTVLTRWHMRAVHACSAKRQSSAHAFMLVPSAAVPRG